MTSRLLLAALSASLLIAPAGRASGKVDFGREILPILSDNCFHCHGPDPNKRKAKLRLDDEQNVKKIRGAVVAGKSAESELYRRLTTADPKEVMPPPASTRKLTVAQIALVKRWIDEGATWGEHWALRPLVQPTPPRPVGFAADVLNPIDAFVLARLEKEGLHPAPAADLTRLIRRASLDLTGLPPRPDEVDAFVRAAEKDQQSVYKVLVERLLASPAFGERMAWDWLDAARYADSNGYQGDGDRTMWPWRDWVVSAFNQNLPYDQFTVWQLAGDLLAGATPEQKLATAFCRNHMINGEGGRIAEENRVDYVMDMTETMGTVWLGLTLNCCRCHDHKYDRLTRRDYYGLFAFFNQTPVDGGGGNPQTPPVLELVGPEQKARLAELARGAKSVADEVERLESKLLPRPEGKSADESAKAATLPEAIKTILKVSAGKRGPNQLGQLEKQWDKAAPDYVAGLQKLRAAVESRENFNRAMPRVMVMEDLAKPRPTFMLDKGLYNKPGEPVSAAVPAALPPLAPGTAPNRLALARWLVDPANPLTARVTVNRFWQQFFGTGLVKTTEDLGVQGEEPSHPELLDWLAADFVASGWDVKHLCRLIVTSATYRQAAQTTTELRERDPHNRLLARGPRYRLPSWMLRDQALAASGLLVDRHGGPPVKPYQPTGVWEDATFGNKQYRQDKGEALYRRSLYTFWRRIVGPTMFFDSPSRQVCTVKQSRTNTPLHALATLNDVTYVEAARALAERTLLAEAQPAQRIEHAFRLVLARKPSAEETQVLLTAVTRLQTDFRRDPEAARKLVRIGDSRRNEALDPVEHAAYAALCSAILNLDEALTRE
jgi:mono/diheme cytochrome c family protein